MKINTANLRDLIAVTSLVISLKLDSNHWFFSPYDLEIWRMTSKNDRAPRLGYINLCALFQSHQWIDQSHRYGSPWAAFCKPAGSYDKTTRTAICFEHKTQYLLIRAPYTRIVIFCHISDIPPMISQSQISCNTPTFYIAAIFVKYCYTTGSWLL